MAEGRRPLEKEAGLDFFQWKCGFQLSTLSLPETKRTPGRAPNPTSPFRIRRALQAHLLLPFSAWEGRLEAS